MLRLLRLGVRLGVDDEDVGVGAVGDPELQLRQRSQSNVGFYFLYSTLKSEFM